MKDFGTFGDGLRKGLAIRVRCACGKQATFRASDFCDILRADESIADRTWRCSWCGERASDVRFAPIDRNDREGMAQWRSRNGAG